MTDLQCNGKLSIINDELSDAASTLLKLKNVTYATSTSNKFDDNVLTTSDNMDNTVWVAIFDKVKQELYFIQHFVNKIVKHLLHTDSVAIVDKTFDDIKTLTSNGYVVIQHAVTIVCNQFRDLLQHSLQQHCVDRNKFVKYGNLFFRIIHYINRYESHMWEEHIKYCNSYSPSSELQFFKLLLNNSKTTINKVLPAQRAIIVDTIQKNIMCIEKTGLLARHAYRHFVHVLEEVSNIPNTNISDTNTNSSWMRLQDI